MVNSFSIKYGKDSTSQELGRAVSLGGGGKPILYYGLNRNIVVSPGKEINRDPVSSGERTQDSLVILSTI